MLPPLTVMLPEEGDEVYPATDAIVYEYVPLGMENDMLPVVDDSGVPLKVTDQDVPVGRPDSVNVTKYAAMGLPLAKMLTVPDL